jgi:hypothetical protein
MSTSNPGPAITTTPEPQAPIGNVQKVAVLSVTLAPAATAAAITAAQSFASLGLGLLAGDIVLSITPPAVTPAGVFPVGGIVTAADTVSVLFANATAGSLTAPTGTYVLTVLRPQPYFSQNASYLTSF